jgi:uncharacterized membrane protein YidH (DUF202 family)
MPNWFIDKTRHEHFGLALISITLLSALLAYAAPLGLQNQISFGWRMSVWFAVVCCAAAVLALHRLFERKTTPHWHPVISDLVLVGLMCLCLTPVILAASQYLQSDFSMRDASVLGIGQFVGTITAGICVVIRCMPGLSVQRYYAQGEAVEMRPAPIQPRLANRLPDDFVGPVLRLTVNDHLVEVISAKQVHRLRMRFGDAVNEMEPVEGFCTHRSHWVTRDAVSKVERQDNRLQVVLTNADRVPVSRKYRANLEIAGLL